MTPRRPCDADRRANQATVLAWASGGDKGKIDKANVCELGSLEAFKQFQRQREAERYDW